MNCLECKNFWKTDIDEAKCDKCGCDTPKESEDKKAELVDLWNNEWKLRLEEKVYEVR